MIETNFPTALARAVLSRLAAIALVIPAGATGLAHAQDTTESVAAQAYGAATDSVDQLDHVRIAPPAGTQPAPAYGGVCVWRCVVFETRDGRDWGLPFIVVHQPFALSGEAMLDAFIAAKDGSEDYRVFDVSDRRSGAPGDGSRLVMQTVWAERDYEDSGDPSILTAIERDGASVLVELHGRVRSDLAEQQQAYAALMSSVSFDGAAVAASSRARSEGLTAAGRALERGYAEGGAVQLYTRYEVRTLLMPGMDGMATMNVQHDRDTLALLPGGVALEETPDDGFRSPDLAALYGAAAPTRWTREGRGIALTGEEATVRLTRRDGTLVPQGGGRAWQPVARLDPDDLVGAYTYGSLNAMGGAMGGMAVSARDGDMTLRADRTYAARRASFGGASAGGGSARSSREATETGRWAFDPASYTLTLTPDDGPPVAVPAFRRDAECVDGVCKWEIGETLWERRQGSGGQAAPSRAPSPAPFPAERPAPAASEEQDTDGARERGACGFPIYQDLQRAGQEILAKWGRCDEYTGPRT